MAESAVAEDQILADLHNLSIVEVAGIANRWDQGLKQHPVVVAGVRRVMAVAGDLAGFAVGMGRQVAAEGRCLLVVHYTIQARILVVAADGEVVEDKRCTQAVRNRAGSNRIPEGH